METQDIRVLTYRLMSVVRLFMLLVAIVATWAAPFISRGYVFRSVFAPFRTNALSVNLDLPVSLAEAL